MAARALAMLPEPLLSILHACEGDDHYKGNFGAIADLYEQNM